MGDEEMRKLILFVLLMLIPVFAFGAEFLPYKPTYAVVEPELDDLKIQFSFLYQPFEGFEYLKFGYTQTSYLALQEPSKPFKDHTFNPEVRVETKWLNGGYEHLSNGRDMDVSRSFNRVYVGRAFELPLNLTVSGRAWAYTNVSHDNEDIKEYWGSSEVSLAHTNNLFSVVGSYRDGAESGTSTVAVVVPIKIFGFLPKVRIEAVNGYESLLNYNVREKVVRVGVQL